MERKSPIDSPQLSSMLSFVKISSVKEELPFTKSDIPLEPAFPTELPRKIIKILFIYCFIYLFLFT